MWLEVLGLLAGGIVGATMISLAVDSFTQVSDLDFKPFEHTL